MLEIKLENEFHEEDRSLLSFETNYGEKEHQSALERTVHIIEMGRKNINKNIIIKRDNENISGEISL